MNILLGITGSVASIYTDKLIDKLKQIGTVKVVMTGQSKQFTNCEFRSDVQCFSDEDDKYWTKIGDDILHIELRNWADVFVIAPLSANSLAKIYNGICDNLLTSIVRCWDFSKKIVLCPSMNCEMWNNYPTEEHVKKLKDVGFIVINPVSKKLACGDIGIGGLADFDDIVKEVKETWFMPLGKKTFIPVNNHPGSFWFHRKGYYHTGVDLYCQDGDNVYAVEDGFIVDFGLFTGKEVGTEHWLTTHFLAVQGKSGVIVYGEIYEPKINDSFNLMTFVEKGSVIGKIKQVIPDGKERPDIPHHSKSMLHIELYRHDSVNFKNPSVTFYGPVDGDDRFEKNRNLLNPTNRLLLSNA